ncbi:2-amino-4-hydroxy-6-hydroxymethyldihydropteridine diphosphokinase [Novosphingobium sp. FGD1]|uniref:2-amino-4-hydroxy-6-hydroxymethyldihydropteridine pyrophosphokinase n=1 Tax=Novosphingobium silvae TaxID=2692619 RepID=A0A7X4GI11_9SPHN|nr:2-amino-4-hydroxy-6-hydroxymethyldihydropteridine diphosphokinase [Novosphingobium silvae]MYL98596.1 2-amino-4-hydroxy-6-hydroxymethyldihydropteridine diphosphokinase [Novosphingobium silvae]
MDSHRYLVALGSNVRHGRHGAPRRVLAAALQVLGLGECRVLAASRIIETAPLGPSRRRYANAAAVVRSSEDPEAFLDSLHEIEQDFGRRRLGRAWGARVLDLDIVLWDGGAYATSQGGLVVPHQAFRSRRFVLDPAVTIAGEWRDPLTHMSIRQLQARLTKRRQPLR